MERCNFRENLMLYLLMIRKRSIVIGQWQIVNIVMAPVVEYRQDMTKVTHSERNEA